jgi:hypothetical protein
MAATALAQPNPNLQAAASSVAHKINGVSRAIFQITLVITTSKLMTERLLQLNPISSASEFSSS